MSIFRKKLWEYTCATFRVLKVCKILWYKLQTDFHARSLVVMTTWYDSAIFRMSSRHLLTFHSPRKLLHFKTSFKNRKGLTLFSNNDQQFMQRPVKPQYFNPLRYLRGSEELPSVVGAVFEIIGMPPRTIRVSINLILGSLSYDSVLL